MYRESIKNLHKAYLLSKQQIKLKNISDYLLPISNLCAHKANSIPVTTFFFNFYSLLTVKQYFQALLSNLELRYIGMP